MYNIILAITLSVKIKIKTCLLGQLSYKKHFTKIQIKKQFENQSIKTSCTVFRLYRTFREIESHKNRY